MSRVISDVHNEWKSQSWLAIDTEAVKESCDDHVISLVSLDACSLDWNIRKKLDEAVNEIQVLHTPLPCSPLSIQQYYA